MFRELFSKAMWLGRVTSAVVGLAVVLALLVGAGSTALAHTNVDNKLFHLGHRNSAATPTSLVSTLAKATKSALIVQNKSGGAALDLRVQSGKPPMKVNSTAKVVKLNADQLDGQEASSFAAGTNGKADSAVHADSATNSEHAGSATDADKLGGESPAAYQRRVSGECAAGSSIRAIDANGTPTCEPDDDNDARVDQLESDTAALDARVSTVETDLAGKMTSSIETKTQTFVGIVGGHQSAQLSCDSGDVALSGGYIMRTGSETAAGFEVTDDHISGNSYTLAWRSDVLARDDATLFLRCFNQQP